MKEEEARKLAITRPSRGRPSSPSSKLVPLWRRLWSAGRATRERGKRGENTLPPPLPSFGVTCPPAFDDFTQSLGGFQREIMPSALGSSRSWTLAPVTLILLAGMQRLPEISFLNSLNEKQFLQSVGAPLLPSPPAPPWRPQRSPTLLRPTSRRRRQTCRSTST